MKLLVDANFNIGAARDLERPTQYETQVKSKGFKGSAGLGFQLQEAIAITVFLEQSGLVEWARSTAYDALWEYLKNFIGLSSDGPLPPKTSITVSGQDGSARLVVSGIDLENIDQAKIEVREEVNKSTDGSTTHLSTVTFDFKAKK